MTEEEREWRLEVTARLDVMLGHIEYTRILAEAAFTMGASKRSNPKIVALIRQLFPQQANGASPPANPRPQQVVDELRDRFLQNFLDTR